MLAEGLALLKGFADLLQLLRHSPILLEIQRLKKIDRKTAASIKRKKEREGERDRKKDRKRSRNSRGSKLRTVKISRVIQKKSDFESLYL